VNLLGILELGEVSKKENKNRKSPGIGWACFLLCPRPNSEAQWAHVCSEGPELGLVLSFGPEGRRGTKGKGRRGEPSWANANWATGASGLDGLPTGEGMRAIAGLRYWAGAPNA
jgi:hypothetical protein